MVVAGVVTLEDEGGGGRDGNRPMRVVMNGVDVTDISQNFTSDEWDKLRACGGHTYVTQRREYVNGRHGGRSDNRGGRGNRGGRNQHGGRYNDNATSNSNETRNVSAANTNSTEIVEYDASNSTIVTQSSSSGRGGQSGGRFGPRRND